MEFKRILLLVITFFLSHELIFQLSEAIPQCKLSISSECETSLASSSSSGTQPEQQPTPKQQPKTLSQMFSDISAFKGEFKYNNTVNWPFQNYFEGETKHYIFIL